METALRQRVLLPAGSFLQGRLNQDVSDYAGPHLPCACGARARYAGRRKKCFRSVLGELTLERAYYHCPACGQGFYPRDQQFHLEGTTLSPAVTRMTALVAALVSFQESSELLQELAGVQVDAKQVERTAEALGVEIAGHERRDLEPSDNSALPQTLYAGLDGTGIPMRREELAGRAGKQPDGTAKTREVKLCTVWSAEGRDQEGTPVRDEGSVTYSATIESAANTDLSGRAEFTERVLREATRRRSCQAERQVVLGDGAPWIWNIRQELFPHALEIVDRFHAKQHLSDLGKALFGPTDPRAPVGARAPRATRHGAVRRAAGRHRRACPPKSRGAPLSPLLHYQSPPHALSRVPAGRLVHLDRRGRGRLQSGHRHPAQTGGHALDAQRVECDHCATVLQAQRPLPRLLGVPLTEESGIAPMSLFYRAPVSLGHAVPHQLLADAVQLLRALTLTPQRDGDEQGVQHR